MSARGADPALSGATAMELSESHKWAKVLGRYRIAIVLFSTGLLASSVCVTAHALPAKQSSSASDQERSQQQAPKTPPLTIQDSAAVPVRVTTRLVQLNVIVNDKHGRPITGLTKKDFALFDNKKPQEIRLFAAESNSLAVQPAAPLPPNTYSNDLSARSNVPASVTIILLDALNTQFADQALTRKEVFKFLDQIRPEDRIALYWLGNDLWSLQDFTSDVSNLRAALLHPTPESGRDLAESDANYLTLNNPNPSVPSGLSGGQTSNREAFRSAFDQRVANESIKNRVHLTVAALIAIAQHVGSLKGRKNIVWVSGSFPFSIGQEKFDLNWANDTGGQGFSGEIARAVQALTAADIAVYPVDARGLMGAGVTAAGDFSDAPHPEFSGEDDERLPSRVAPGNLETMKTLAERTGGKAFYGSNNISGAIRRAIDDSRETYTLGFYPANTTWDGGFHRLRVKVSIPGAEARTRTGYFALPDAANTPAKSLQAIISQTAISQLDATAIGLRVHVELAGAAGSLALNITLHLDLHDIEMHHNTGVWTSGLQTVFLQLDSHGEILQGLDETLHVALPQEIYEQALKDGLKNTRELRILPGAAQLCVVLRDPANGNLGSVSIPIAKYFPPPSHAPD